MAFGKVLEAEIMGDKMMKILTVMLLLISFLTVNSGGFADSSYYSYSSTNYRQKMEYMSTFKTHKYIMITVIIGGAYFALNAYRKRR